MKPAITLCVLVASLSANLQAQTPTLYTNRVTADPNFRRVNGQLHNVQKSVLWKSIQGEFFAKQSEIVILTTFVNKSYDVRGGSVTHQQSLSAYAGPSFGTSTRTYRDYGRRIAVTNCPARNIAEGVTLSAVAMKTGTLNYGGTTLDLWDCGTPNVVTVVTTNPPAPGAISAQEAYPTAKTNDSEVIRAFKERYGIK